MRFLHMSHTVQGILLFVHQLYVLRCVIHGSDPGLGHDELEHLVTFLDQHRSLDMCYTYDHAPARNKQDNSDRF